MTSFHYIIIFCLRKYLLSIFFFLLSIGFKLGGLFCTKFSLYQYSLYKIVILISIQLLPSSNPVFLLGLNSKPSPLTQNEGGEIGKVYHYLIHSKYFSYHPALTHKLILYNQLALTRFETDFSQYCKDRPLIGTGRAILVSHEKF